MHNDNKKAYIAASVTAVIFGFSFLFTKSALDYLDTFQLLGFRFLAAAFFLSALKLAGIIKIEIKAAGIKKLLLVALFQPVLYFIFETVGVARTSASESSIMISLVPIAVTVLAVFFLKERLSAFQWVSVTVSVAGVVIIILSKGSEGGSGQVAGIFALLGAVAAGAFYNVLSRKVSDSFTPIETTYVMMWVGAAVFAGTGIVSAALKGNPAGYFSGLGNINVLTGIFYLGIISSVGAFFLLNYSLSRLEASKTAVFLNLIPIVTVVAGITLRDERLNLLQCIGAVIILLGIWGVNRGKGFVEKTVSEGAAL